MYFACQAARAERLTSSVVSDVSLMKTYSKSFSCAKLGIGIDVSRMAAIVLGVSTACVGQRALIGACQVTRLAEFS